MQVQVNGLNVRPPRGCQPSTTTFLLLVFEVWWSSRDEFLGHETPRTESWWYSVTCRDSFIILYIFLNLIRVLTTTKEFTLHNNLSYYRQTCAKRSHAGIVFTQYSKNRFFALQGRHVVPINVKFGTGERTSPVPHFMFTGAEMWEYSPQNCQNFEFWS